ncbi:glutamate racemase [Hathewaya histolytica]|uniref:Glutamate racemase n=1 Tax=Hathewaya histolytica TaxID=1498 RepID=A0A4U9S203_HATHI|nr:glutamate racemase [Hathewaya histolytica]VTQ95600.1 glutamate racemase MurI [Hathewaya histolytica]
MEQRDKSIGFFDSGLGGISVLKEALKIMPNENYIYFGDSKNAPYGRKSIDEVKDLTFKAIEFLLSKDVKAIVVACNTATSAAIRELREKYSSIPIVGIEPAVKPAVKLDRNGKIVIMATPVTLAQKKFKDLYEQYKLDTEIEPLPCPELVEFVERGEVAGERVFNYIKEKLSTYEYENIGAIVLGCTHYPFVEEIIKKVVGDDIPVIHGGEGTAKQLQRLLKENDIQTKNNEKGIVEVYNSLEDEKIMDLSKKLLDL